MIPVVNVSDPKRDRDSSVFLLTTNLLLSQGTIRPPSMRRLPHRKDQMQRSPALSGWLHVAPIFFLQRRPTALQNYIELLEAGLGCIMRLS